MVQTDQKSPSVSSQTKGLQVNADGSVDVFFGPKPPAGKEDNWVQRGMNAPWLVAWGHLLCSFAFITVNGHRVELADSAMRRGGSRPVRRAMSAVVIHWRGRLTIREGTLVLQEWPDSPYTIMIYGNKPPLSSLIDWSPSKLPGN
jgi:Protein of unknown function (DUF1214)